METGEKRDLSGFFMKLIPILIAAAIIAVSLLSVSGIRKNTSDNGCERLEKSVRRAVMACYATEGIYPENIQHLRDYYGLQVDDSRYSVKYSVFAENIMPDVTVTETSR
ncbi:MAG: hypothetical protein Q4F31_09085 [Eubacteriales bacterium]|nr:hypothetical protein [Eubacteriales bacterium]